jgi:50S ribosomal subunit-associated GTPase HflX
MTQYIQEGRLRHFDGILYVYDLTNPHSVIQLEQLFEEVRNCDHGELVSIIVGNKADLIPPSISAQPKGLESNEAFYLAKKFSERHRLLHQSVSAKLNSCVADCFILIIKEALSLRRHIRTSRLGEEEEILQV